MKCKRPWFYFGILLGFLSGFSYFAYHVYNYGHNRGVSSYTSTKMMHSGATTHRSYE